MKHFFFFATNTRESDKVSYPVSLLNMETNSFGTIIQFLSPNCTGKSRVKQIKVAHGLWGQNAAEFSKTRQNPYHGQRGHFKLGNS